MVSFILFCIGMESSAGSKPEEEYDYYKSRYSGEAIVFTERRQSVNYSIVNDEIVTKIYVYEEMLHLGENTARYAGDKVYSSEFIEISDLKAYTLVPGKKKYERIDVTEFKESFDKNSSVFYDDNKEITFTYPSVQKGVKTVIEYTKTVKDPRLMSMFFFNTYIPVDKATYMVEYDKGVTINPQFYNAEFLQIKTEENKPDPTKSGITFTASGIEKIKFDRDCPSYNYLGSSVYCPVSQYITANGENEYVISSTRHLHDWYRTFLHNIKGDDDGLQELVHSIVDPGDDTLEKVRKIFYWVQANIKYIAFEDGMRGFVPHSGKYVIDKRYGDCKDMASAIVTMLRETGIEAFYSWIGSRDLPYTYSEFPAPITDDHMIATFIHEGKTYFLDATGQYTPLGLPTSMIQGKECLISISDDDFTIKKVPVISRENNVMADSVFISLENGTVVGNGHISLTGYAKVFNSYKLIKATQKSIDDYVQRLLTKGSNKFQLREFEISNVSELEIPTSIDYEFSIPDYYREIGDKIYINPILDKTMTDGFLENRSVAIENDYKYINRNIVKLTIPEDYTLNSIPENTRNYDENFGFNITYAADGPEVIVTKEFYLDYLVMEPEEFTSWNNLISEYAVACRKAIILSKK